MASLISETGTGINKHNLFSLTNQNHQPLSFSWMLLIFGDFLICKEFGRVGLFNLLDFVLAVLLLLSAQSEAPSQAGYKAKKTNMVGRKPGSMYKQRSD